MSRHRQHYSRRRQHVPGYFKVSFVIAVAVLIGLMITR
jgi:hypothetical protein